MPRERTILAAVSVVLAAAVVAFLVFLRDSDPELGAGDATPAPERAESDVERGRARRVVEPEGVAIPNPLDVEPHLPLHEPVFGDLVRSGTARVEFEIVDARQQRLPSRARLRASLYRLEAGAGILDQAHVDEERGVVVCAGTAGGGLEPGDYALRISAGPYGALWKDFSVAKGQLLRQRLSLETWTRVIRLRFEDPAGAGHPRIPIRPTYAVDDVRAPARTFGDSPSRVLREPPGKEEPAAIGVGGGGAGGSYGGRPRAWLTNDGAWSMQVVAGTPGRFRLSASKKRHGRDDLEITSTFEGPEWDDYRIVLDFSEFQAARLRSIPPGNPDDPGQESELLVAEPGARDGEPDPAELPRAPTSWTRLIFRHDGPPNVRLRFKEPPYSQSLGHLGFSYRDRVPRRSSGVWYVDVALKRADVLEWSWNDGALFESERRVLEKSEFDIGEPLIERRESLAFMPLAVEVTPVSPTLDGWARSVTAAWSGSKIAEQLWRARSYPRTRDTLRIESAVPLDREGRPVFGASLRLRFRGDARASRRDVSIRWTDAMSRDARDGRVQITPLVSGLALRAVDDVGRGLPWVEGTLLELSELRRAEHIRESLAEAGIATGAGSKFLSVDTPRVVHRALDMESGRPAFRELLGDELFAALADDDSALRAARNGAWYDPWRRLRGDGRGFIVSLDTKLELGRRYVLWLWSRSRDANAPDRRIIFEAGPGLTDLGAIELPR